METANARGPDDFVRVSSADFSHGYMQLKDLETVPKFMEEQGTEVSFA